MRKASLGRLFFVMVLMDGVYVLLQLVILTVMPIVVTEGLLVSADLRSDKAGFPTVYPDVC